MALPDNYQILLESYQPVAAKPYLQPLVVPKSPRYLFWSGFLMNGTIPFGVTIWPYWTAPRSAFSRQKPLTAPTNIAGSTRVFSGQSPNRGIYTGVK